MDSSSRDLIHSLLLSRPRTSTSIHVLAGKVTWRATGGDDMSSATSNPTTAT